MIVKTEEPYILHLLQTYNMLISLKFVIRMLEKNFKKWKKK